MIRAEMIESNERMKADMAAMDAQFEKQLARYRQVEVFNKVIVSALVETLNAPWRALAEDIRRLP